MTNSENYRFPAHLEINVVSTWKILMQAKNQYYSMRNISCWINLPSSVPEGRLRTPIRSPSPRITCISEGSLLFWVISLFLKIPIIGLRGVHTTGESLLFMLLLDRKIWHWNESLLPNTSSSYNCSMNKICSLSFST